jgi:hypothetical protein
MKLIIFALEVADALKYISQLGVVSLLIGVLIGGFRKWWVWGWAYTDLLEQKKLIEQERDDWRQLALKGTTLAEQSVGLFRTRG